MPKLFFQCNNKVITAIIGKNVFMKFPFLLSNVLVNNKAKSDRWGGAASCQRKERAQQTPNSSTLLLLLPLLVYYPTSTKLQVKQLSPTANSGKCTLSLLSLFLFVDLFLSVTPSSPPPLMICCDFRRENMETAQRGSRTYSLITSVTNYSAQHAQSVAPEDPFSPPLYLIYL